MTISASRYNQPSVPARFHEARQGLIALKSVVSQTAAQEDVRFEARYSTRIKFTAQPLYASRPVYEMRNVYENRDVTEEREVYETRPVYTERPVYETSVTGSRDLSGFASASAAGLDDKADFSVRVGSGALATVTFTGTNIAVTQNGATRNYAYSSSVAGGFQSALVSALEGLEGASASLNAGGRLVVSTENAESLTLNEVANGFLDVSGTALDKLGLTAGTTNAQQAGTETEETGSEEVLVGRETVVIGSESVQVGTEKVETGKESYITGSQLVEDGTEQFITGYERVVTGTGTDNLELRAKQVSARQSLAQLVTAAQKELSNTGPIGRRVVEGLSSIITMLGSTNPLTGGGLDNAVKRMDQARSAYFTSSQAAQATGNLFSKIA